MKRISVGLDVFQDEYWHRFKGQRLGLLSNQASLDRHLRPAKYVISELMPGQLKGLFGPQHGHGGAEQDNMIETEHSYDAELKLPIFSLYSGTREPLEDMLDLMDTLIIDLQDVGTRVYTFSSTVLNCLKAASSTGKNIVILDRPNPLGGEIVEGNLLKQDLHSFVGPFAFPMRHGLTMAEMAGIFHSAFGLNCDLDIVPMHGWERKMLWQDTGVRWAMPSPNMPIPESAMVYPGQVIWEGTNISEGRGTCRPFEMFGAPFLNPKAVRAFLHPAALQGCILQEITFRPTFQKWRDETCLGYMIHVLDPLSFMPYFSSLALLRAILNAHGDRFEWRLPPYEYEFERMPIDLILGDRSVRENLEKGEDMDRIRERWEPELLQFLEWRESFLLYH